MQFCFYFFNQIYMVNILPAISKYMCHLILLFTSWKSAHFAISQLYLFLTLVAVFYFQSFIEPLTVYFKLNFISLPFLPLHMHGYNGSGPSHFNSEMLKQLLDLTLSLIFLSLQCTHHAAIIVISLTQSFGYVTPTAPQEPSVVPQDKVQTFQH